MRGTTGGRAYPGAAHGARLSSPAVGAFERLAGLLEAERPRWALWAPVFLGLGALGYLQLPTEPSFVLAFGLFAGTLAARGLAGRGTFAVLLSGALVASAAGFLVAKVRAAAVSAPVLSDPGRPVAVEGLIELVEAREGGGLRLTILPRAIEGVEADALPGRVRVSVLPPKDDRDSGPYRGLGLFPGQSVRLVAHLRAPQRPALPGGFDFSRFAFFRGIGAVGYATTPPQVVPGDGGATAMERANHALARTRQAIGARVEAALPGETGAIAKALITGDRSGIPDEVNEAYRASGLYHILSISGLHMAIMGGAVFFALRFILAALPGIALNYPIKKWAAAGAILGGLAYLAISGGSYATQRSFLMVVVFFAAILLDRPAIALRNVAISALLILVVFPESVVDPGFQMSFAAVIGLVASYEALASRAEPLLQGERTWLWRTAGFFGGIVGSTLVASAAVAPLGIYHFHQTQHYAAIANLAAVPICNLIVMPAALAALVLMPFGGEAAALAVMGAGIDGMGRVANWVAGLDGAVGRVGAMPAAALAAIVAGGLWLCLMRQRWRRLGLIGIAAGAALVGQGSRPDVLIGDGGRLVMVRGADGRLSGINRGSADYELGQWLARDGDGREPGEVGPEGALSCDRVGCVARVGGMVIAISEAAASLAADCRRADILVSKVAPPTPCERPKLAVERAESERLGTIAITFNGDSSRTGDAWRIETVEGARGERPWSVATGLRGQ